MKFVKRNEGKKKCNNHWPEASSFACDRSRPAVWQDSTTHDTIEGVFQTCQQQWVESDRPTTLLLKAMVLSVQSMSWAQSITVPGLAFLCWTFFRADTINALARSFCLSSVCA